MVIYIDVLIFTNVIINYCILSASKKFLHIKTSQIRIVLASLFGALFSLTTLINDLQFLLSILLKIVCAGCMCLIAFYKNSLIGYLKSIVLAFIFSMIFSSGILLYCEIIKPKNIAIINDTVYFDINPFWLIVITVFVYIITLILQRIFRNDVKNTDVELKFGINDSVYTCKAKIDTGCNAIEPFSGAPVIIAEKSILKDLELSKPRIIPYHVLGNNSMMYAVKANKVYIDNKEINKEIYIAVFDGFIDNSVKAIINSEILR